MTKSRHKAAKLLAVNGSMADEQIPSREAAKDYSPGRTTDFAVRPASEEDSIIPGGAIDH
jgi:hypothetical protein